MVSLCRPLASLALLALLASGCTAPPSDRAADSATATPSAESGAVAGYCGLVRSQRARLSLSAETDLSDRAALRRTFEEVRAAYRRAAAVAPEEIRADAAVFAGALKSYVDGLRAADFDFTKVPPDVQRILSSSAVAEAQQRVERYNEKHCPA